jgi:hypothetical protein
MSKNALTKKSNDGFEKFVDALDSKHWILP